MKREQNKISRLQTGSKVLKFCATDSDGRYVNSEDLRGRKTLLCFFRYASCPLCNLRVNELSQATADFEQRGIQIMAVFHSSSSQIQKYVGKQRPPFRMIADPELKLYELFGIEQSRLAVLKGFLFRFATSGLKAMARGYLPGDIDGTNNTVPADFVIDANLEIERTYYGSDIGDHIPLVDVTKCATKTSQ